MASNDGDQSPEKDLNESFISDYADSGRGLSGVSSVGEESQRHVSPNLDEVETGVPVQTDTSQGNRAPALEPYHREIASQEGENEELYDGDSSETTTKSVVQPSDTTKRDEGEDVRWQSVYNRKDNVFELLIVDPASGKWKTLQLGGVSVNRVNQEGPGNLSVHVTGLEIQHANKITGQGAVAGNQQRNVLKDLQDLSLSDAVLSYQRTSEVSEDLTLKVRKRGAGKSRDVQKFFSFIEGHLKEFDEVEDCYILPLQNGLLISQVELRVGNIEGGKLTVAQTTVQGTIVLLNPAVSEDMSTAYRPETQTTPGDFAIRERLGKGAEGPVHNAADVGSNDEFAVKKILLEKFDEAAAAAFLKLKGSKHTCRPYGLVLDEENDCVLFLMEKVRGKTLREFLKDPTRQMEIPLAVNYTIDILKGLKYIHSQEMMHSDVAARNVIIDGPRATLIDMTGAKNQGSIKGWDEAGALCLLNSMLTNKNPATIHLCESSELWKASVDELSKVNPTTLGKLEQLLEEEAKTPLSQTQNVDELLPVLQEISDGLTGLEIHVSSDTVDSQDSLDGSVPSPPNFQITPEGAARVESIAGLKKQIEELTEEKEKYRKGFSGAEERLQEKEKQIKDLHESRNQLSDLVNTREEELENLEGVLKVARSSEKKWKAKAECLEAENKDKTVMLDRAEQDNKALKDELDALKADMKKIQLRAEQDKNPRAEE